MVGINGSGKSNFFKALRLLKEGVVGRGLLELINSEWQGINKVKHLKTTLLNALLTKVVLLEYEFKNVEDYIYKIELNTHVDNDFYLSESLVRINVSGEPTELLKTEKSKIIKYENPFPQIILKDKEYNKYELLLKDSGLFFLDSFFAYNFIESINIYEVIEVSKNSKIRSRVVPSEVKTLSENGGNLVQLLNSFNINDKDTFRKILSALKKINDKFESIDFEFFDNEISLRISESGLNKSISVKHISDGTLKFLCLMAIFYNPNRGSVICIDEPELGLHPDMLHTLYEAIEYAAETSQIIISTHSAHLLDFFELKNVRVFEKDEHNATVVKQYNEENFKGWYDRFLPGIMWRAGDIGGNRW